MHQPPQQQPGLGEHTDNWPTLAEGPHLLTPYPSAPRKGLHCSNPQLKLGGRVPRGLSVLAIEHSEQRLKAGSQVNSHAETHIPAEPFPTWGEVSCMNCLVQAGPQPDRLRRHGEGPPGTETPQAAQSTLLPGSDGNSPRIYVGLCKFPRNLPYIVHPINIC